MRITNITAILHNDETARHLNACWKCKEDKDIQTHMFNFFVFLMGDVLTTIESIKEREDKIKQIQKKITERILDTHYAYFTPNAGYDDVLNKSGYDNYDIGKLNEEMGLYGKLTPINPPSDTYGEYFTDNSDN